MALVTIIPKDVIAVEDDPSKEMHKSTDKDDSHGTNIFNNTSEHNELQTL